MSDKIQKEDKDILSNLAQELFQLAGVVCEVEVNKIDEDSYEVNIKTESEAGLLIGFRGENINSVQTVLTLMFQGQTDRWVRVLVNVGDYRQKQESKLQDLANQTIERVKQTNQPQPIYNLTPSERRVIHLYISEQSDVESYSEGEDAQRYLVVAPKK